MKHLLSFTAPVAIAAAVLSGCSDANETSAFTAPLETAIKAIDLVHKDLSTPERALAYHWARQDARAVARCEAMRLRARSPASREGRIIAAAMATELAWADLYDGELRAHLRYASNPGTDDCYSIVPRYERRLVGIPQRDQDGAAIVFAQVRNIAPLPNGIAEPDETMARLRTEGSMYRYDFRETDKGWLLFSIRERANYDRDFEPIMTETAPGYPMDVAGF